ncbi:MAG TPA: flagella basal body P-ring formation protein FlgA [Terriglobales bacterium]|nr:flagella basal body P-ring formation protein FlgA [Terriglobales bacterium]
MRQIRILGSLAVLVVSWFPLAAQPRCAKIGVRAAAEVGDSGVALADLLTAETCPAIRHAAAMVWLGNAPQPGSARVFDSSEIRRALHELDLAGPPGETEDVRVPERIVVRRAGARTLCSEIEDFVARSLRSRTLIDRSAPATGKAAASPEPARELNCATGDRIPRGAPLELTRVFWDPALQGWEYELRCVRASDCIPFLVRQSSAAANSAAALLSPLDSRLRHTGPQAASAPPAVRVGQSATLVWEQDGIRAVLPVTCLDHGSIGSLIRARTKNGNRILRAEVVSAGILRAAL